VTIKSQHQSIKINIFCQKIFSNQICFNLEKLKIRPVMEKGAINAFFHSEMIKEKDKLPIVSRSILKLPVVAIFGADVEMDLAR